MPNDFGLAAASSTGAYELDLDQVSRLNQLNNHSLTYLDISNAAKLSNIALGITLTQLMTLSVEQTSNHTVGGDTSFTFKVSASIDSKPTRANLQGYVVAEGYQNNATGVVAESGVGYLILQMPTSTVADALLVVFARASFDERVTSYAVYDFASSTQQSSPSSTVLELSPLDYTLSFNEGPGIAVQEAYVFSYSYQQQITAIGNSQLSIPKLIDKSPLVLVVCGLDGADYFSEWTVYPQIPLTTGASFEGSEQNPYSYMVTVNGVLYRLELSLGDVPH